jgi:hypothetical protein
VRELTKILTGGEKYGVTGGQADSIMSGIACDLFSSHLMACIDSSSDSGPWRNLQFLPTASWNEYPVCRENSTGCGGIVERERKLQSEMVNE